MVRCRAVAKVFEIVSTATVSKSAANAKELGFLRPADGVTMNRDRLLYEAKQKALAMAEDYKAPEPPEFTLPGPGRQGGADAGGDDFHNRGLATDYDVVVSEALATVLTGGDADPVEPMSENDLLALERKDFMARLHDPRTLARIEHMLETGKPLAELRRTTMQVYEAPLRDMRFVLHELFDGDGFGTVPGPRGIHPRPDRRDPRGSGQAARSEVLLPLNRSRRRGRLPPRKWRRAHAQGLQGSLRPVPRRRLVLRSPPTRHGAARACPRRSTSWSRK